MVKKQKKVDFQKLKLKVGRSLPKGLNDVNTKFKSRKIKLISQFRSETLEPTTHRKKTIEELLKKCEHGNTASCQEAVMGIRELINSNEELVKKHLPALIQKVSPLIIKREPSIRKSALSVFTIILKTVNEEEAIPFFSILNSHLCCAMKDIDSEVRKDSLKLLEIILDNSPTLICSSTEVLFHFLKQISEKRHCSSSTKHHRVLSVSPSDRLFSQYWRVQVLTTLATFLKAIIQNITLKEDVPITLSDFEFLKSTKCHAICTKNLAEPHSLQEFAGILVPLLFDTWIEAAPSTVIERTSAEVVSPDAAKTMICVLNVMGYLMKWMSTVDKNENCSALMNWFKSRFRNDILKRFMLWFPYSERISSGRKGKDPNPEVTCLSINLVICEMFSTLMLDDGDIVHPLLQKKVSEYLLQVINRENGKTSNMSVLLKIIKKITMHMDPDDFKLHLYGLYNVYKKTELGHFQKDLLLKFLSDLITDSKTYQLIELPAIRMWAQFLPKEIKLMAENNFIDKCALSVMQRFAVFSNPSFLESLEKHIPSLIVLLQDYDVEIQKIMIGFICRLPRISLEDFHAISKALRNPVVKAHTVCALLDILTSRILTWKDCGMVGGHYVSFLLCVTTGMSKSEDDDNVNACRQFQEKAVNVPFDLSPFSIIPSSNTERQLKITEAGIRCLMRLPNVQFTVQAIRSYFYESTIGYTCFPAHGALALLSLEAAVNNENYFTIDAELIGLYSELCIGLLVYEYALDVLNEQDENETPLYDKRIFSFVCSMIKTLGNIGHICDKMSLKFEEIQNVMSAKSICLILLAIVKEVAFDTTSDIVHSLSTLLRVLEDFFRKMPENEKWWNAIKHDLSLYLNHH